MTWEEKVSLASSTVREWVCEGCGKTAVSTAKGLFDKGWDVPPWFSTHTTCNSCPITRTALWVLSGYGK